MIRWENIGRISLILLLCWVAIGCDSGEEDEPTDAEAFVGQWSAVSATAAGLDLLSLLGTLDASFQTASTFTLSGVNEDGESVLDTSGTFAVDEAAGVITFTAVDQPRPVDMNYRFENNDNTIVLIFPGSVLGDLGFDIDPTVVALVASQTITVTLARQ